MRTLAILLLCTLPAFAWHPVFRGSVASSGAVDTSYTPTWKTSSLVAYWPLDETSGTRYDAHGSNDLTDNNTVTYRTGKKSNAAEFDAANNETLSVADNADLSPTTSIAVMGWTYFDIISPAGGRSVFTKGLSASYQMTLTTEGLCADVCSPAQARASSTITASAWHHVALIADATAGKVYLYIDGVEIEGESYSGIVDATDQFRCGSGFDYQFDGAIDEFALFKNPSFTNTTDRRDFVKTYYNSGAGVVYTDRPECLLTESGSALLTESGDYLLIEY